MTSQGMVHIPADKFTNIVAVMYFKGLKKIAVRDSRFPMKEGCHQAILCQFSRNFLLVANSSKIFFVADQ